MLHMVRLVKSAKFFEILIYFFSLHAFFRSYAFFLFTFFGSARQTQQFIIIPFHLSLLSFFSHFGYVYASVSLFLCCLFRVRGYGFWFNWIKLLYKLYSFELLLIVLRLFEGCLFFFVSNKILNRRNRVLPFHFVHDQI